MRRNLVEGILLLGLSKLTKICWEVLQAVPFRYFW